MTEMVRYLPIGEPLNLTSRKGDNVISNTAMPHRHQSKPFRDLGVVLLIVELADDLPLSVRCF